MFRRILIANRGEIACRIIDTARRLGVETVAVYSDADARARHVEMADQAVHIGGPAPADSYLRGDVIIAAALATGARAIHPGYGFLSENPDFVDEVEQAGLVFIGPSASAIRAMGLKDAAKALMEKAGVPVVPGYHGANQSDDHLSGAADAIGYPVLIKAVAGGGGKGMRRVDDPADFAQALASARSEAKGAFGNDAVLIEKYIQKPRHIEMQVFGDGKTAVHLFERDCSLQRRHQKVIEEAPAPGMSDEIRAAMGAAAVRAATAIGYQGAGTVEFIVDSANGLRPDGFWFMEMNTRLQVEHPVSEAVTGVDLVEWQLRVAAGEALPATQDEITLNGHAFEARLYAEDVSKGFLPATGHLAHLRFPTGVRADTGVRPGDEISPWYDPMIAKIITHGPTREIALSKLSAALSETEVAGTVTNLTFLGALAADADFVAGMPDTGLIERHQDKLTAIRTPGATERARAALCAAGLDGPTSWETAFTLWQPMAQTVWLCENNAAVAVRLTFAGRDIVHVETAGETVAFQHRAGGWRDGAGRAHRTLRIADKIFVFGPQTFEYGIVDPLDLGNAEAEGGNLVTAPMPGLVRAVFAVPGQRVSAGDRLAVLEAMKMEHTLKAGRDGVVGEVFAKAGAQVNSGAALIRLEDET